MTKQALKFLQGLDAKQYKQVATAIFGLFKETEPHDSQALKGATRNERSIDAGEYRIIYTANTELIEVLVIGKRNDDDVYKIWGNMR
ncbi:MAG: type II toxin-antitoxin system RelE family toxin [Methylophilaceae bacterium]